MYFTIEQIEQAIADYSGFCAECGIEACNVEPDARLYECDECGALAVFGAEELLIMGKVH